MPIALILRLLAQMAAYSGGSAVARGVASRVVPAGARALMQKMGGRVAQSGAAQAVNRGSAALAGKLPQAIGKRMPTVESIGRGIGPAALGSVGLLGGIGAGVAVDGLFEHDEPTTDDIPRFSPFPGRQNQQQVLGALQSEADLRAAMASLGIDIDDLMAQQGRRI